MRHTLPQDIQNDVNAVIGHGRCHATEGIKFLDAILPVHPDCTDEVYRVLRAQNIYSDNRWLPFSQKQRKKFDYAQGLLSVAEFIHNICPKSAKHSFPFPIPSYWDSYSYSHKLSKSRNLEASAVRPDICLLVSPSNGHALAATITQRRKEFGELIRSTGIAKYLKTLQADPHAKIPSDVKKDWRQFSKCLPLWSRR